MADPKELEAERDFLRDYVRDLEEELAQLRDGR